MTDKSVALVRISDALLHQALRLRDDVKIIAVTQLPMDTLAQTVSMFVETEKGAPPVEGALPFYVALEELQREEVEPDRHAGEVSTVAESGTRGAEGGAPGAIPQQGSRSTG